MRPLRVAFDIGGVLSKYPDQMRELVVRLAAGGAEVYVITDMHQRDQVLGMLERNGFGHPMIQRDRVRCADYDKYGEGCKAVLCRELEIDIMLDDFVGYVAVPGAPIRCLVMPDASRPYYANDWVTVGAEGSFGRRVFGPSPELLEQVFESDPKLQQLRDRMVSDIAEAANVHEPRFKVGDRVYYERQVGECPRLSIHDIVEIGPDSISHGGPIYALDGVIGFVGEEWLSHAAAGAVHEATRKELEATSAAMVAEAVAARAQLANPCPDCPCLECMGRGGCGTCGTSCDECDGTGQDSVIGIDCSTCGGAE